ncbi:hypothetical protein LMH87_004701 [Akanthomyces muscarius]|uniref:Uncharacterized protein n=1 Tax=Akanthomyces muscarius TaxID=2231603 RepID=A0A9W8Q5W3_AKAMU|nr:hypothetical protein LMH87_004701 [Akanthomyces muscarius]KAJ4145869.1 hypothetical protein LMH87_004701 [Akanthomyces muscarius]
MIRSSDDLNSIRESKLKYVNWTGYAEKHISSRDCLLREALAVAGLPGVDLPLEGQYKNSRETGREGRVGLTGMRIFAVEYRILRKRRLHNGEQLSNKRLQGERAFGHYDDGEELEMLLEEDVLLEDEIDDGDESVFEV